MSTLLFIHHSHSQLKRDRVRERVSSPRFGLQVHGGGSCQAVPHQFLRPHVAISSHHTWLGHRAKRIGTEEGETGTNGLTVCGSEDRTPSFICCYYKGPVLYPLTAGPWGEGHPYSPRAAKHEGGSCHSSLCRLRVPPADPAGEPAPQEQLGPSRAR